MALISAVFPIVRQIQRLHLNQLPTKWFTNKQTQPVKLFHGSSTRQSMQSRIIEHFKVSPKKSSKLKQQEKIPKEYALIYMAPEELYIKYGYPVTLLLFVGAPSIILYHYYTHGELLLRKEAREIPILNPQIEITILAGALTLCTWAICSFIFKYPFRVYKHNQKQEYIAMYLSAVPLRLQKHYFSFADKKNFRNPLYFFIPECQYFLEGKKKAILMPQYFRTPADLTDMLGI